MISPTASRLRVAAAAALFSTGGAAIKACSLTGWQVACLRSGIAALALLLLLPAARRGWSWRVPVIGAAYAATLILFVTANKLTTSASAIFMQSTSPLYILLLGPWLLREPVRRRDLLFLAAVGAGVVLFFAGAEPAQETAPDPFRGNIAALMSGATYALTVVGLRWAARDQTGSAEAVVLAGNIIAFLACLPAALPLSGVTLLDWAVLGYLGVFQIGLAYVLLTAGMRHVTALEASLLLLVEPVLNPIWAWLVQGEQPGLWTLMAGAIIILATAIRTIAAERGAATS